MTGTFAAMSVFHPQNMTPMTNAKGHAYFILHSPQDWIRIDQHAKIAVKTLAENGATTKLQMYSGGHGWTDDPHGYISKGIEWLSSHIKAKTENNHGNE